MKLLLLILCLLQVCDALNILIYNPRFGYSHSKFMDKISDVLVEAGHDVVQIAPITDRTLVEGHTKAKRISYEISDEVFAQWAKLAADVNGNMWRMPASENYKFSEMVQMLKDCYGMQCAETLNNSDVMSKLQSQTFDIALSEPFDLCGFAIFHQLKIDKYIAVLSTLVTSSLSRTFGIPRIPSFVPAESTDNKDVMNIRERYENLQAYLSLHYTENLAHEVDTNILPIVGPSFPGVFNLLRASSLVFTNSNPYIDLPSPTIEKFIPIGGISVIFDGRKPLPEKWSTLLSLRPRTVLFSFGTIVKISTMPDDFKKTVSKVMRKFSNVTFIWKTQEMESFGVPMEEATEENSNIVFAPWTPQGDLLADPRLTAFMTHSGLGSINEATATGKPVLVIPFFAEQFHNARMAERVGVAVYYDKTELGDEEKLYKAIDRLLNDKSLQSRSSHISALSRNRPFSPREVVVRNVEFTAKYGPFPHMDPSSTQLTLFQLYMLDIAAIVLTVNVTFLYLVYRIVKYLLGRVTTPKKQKRY